MFDDSAGISLDMVQKLLRAANFLAIQPLIDASCAVIAMAINNTEVTQLQFIDAAQQLLFGAQPRADGRPTVCDTFAVLQDVHAYQPELASKIITAAQTSTSAHAETARGGASADPDTEEGFLAMNPDVAPGTIGCAAGQPRSNHNRRQTFRATHPPSRSRKVCCPR